MLEYVALGILISVGIILFYGVIVIHDIPYDIAKHRNHPHQDAIHVAGWVSLLTLHVIWPFLWIWATLYRADRGWGFGGANGTTAAPGAPANDELVKELSALRARIETLEQSKAAVVATPVVHEGESK